MVSVYFLGKGTNLLNIKCILSNLSDEIQIEDNLFYDNATTNKINNYNTTNTTLSFDTDHYVGVSSTTSSASNYLSFIEPKNMLTLSDFCIECDIKFISGTGQAGLVFIDEFTTVSSTQKTIELISAYNNNAKGLVFRPWTNYKVNNSLTTNTWYNLKITVQGSSVTAIISQNGGNVYSKTATYSYRSDLKHICIYQADASNTIHFKNLKIKTL